MQVDDRRPPRSAPTASKLEVSDGLIASDEVYVEDDKEKVIASFNRIDAGKDFVDHHVFLYVHNENAGLNHISFEVPDFDDVMMGHEHLRDTGEYEHVWGIGRHRRSAAGRCCW